jgi:hypothetical protein
MRARDTAVNAVSELEKKPDNVISTKTAKQGPQIDQSIVFKNSILIPLLSIFGIFIVSTLSIIRKEKQMKSFLVGIFLFIAIIIGGMVMLSMMDVTVPQKDVVVSIPLPADAE